MLGLCTTHAIMQSRLIATDPLSSEDFIASGRVPFPPGSNICARISLFEFHRETSTQQSHKPKKKKYVHYTVPELGVRFCNGQTIKTENLHNFFIFRTSATPAIGHSTLLTTL